jgi:outer membrane protein TolC
MPVLGLAVLAACSQPVKQLPDDMQASWVDEQRAITPADAGASTWWKAFDDSTIDQLVDLAQQRNLDLRVAEARVREVRAQRRATLANLAPQIDASVDAQRSRVAALEPTPARSRKARAPRRTRVGKSICSADCEPKLAPPMRS